MGYFYGILSVVGWSWAAIVLTTYLVTRAVKQNE